MKNSNKFNYFLMFIYSFLGIEFLVKVFNFLVKRLNINLAKFDYNALVLTGMMIVFLGMICSIPFIILSIKKNIFDLKKEKKVLEKYNFIKQRDELNKILDNYSPAEISYIDDYSKDDLKDAAITLLSLKRKNKLDIIDNKIYVDHMAIMNNEDLKESEKVILNNIRDGKLFLELSNPLFRASSISEALSDGLMNTYVEKRIKKENFWRIFKFLSAIIIIVLELLYFAFRIDLGAINGNLVTIGIFFITFVISIFVSILIVFYLIYKEQFIIMQRNSIKRTAKGNDINERLDLIQNYIKNLNKLTSKKQEELKEWENFEMYSIMFGSDIEKLQKLYEVIDITYFENKM